MAPAEPEEPTPWALPVEQGGGDDPARRLAVRIARTIRHWLDSGEMLDSKGRPIHAGDVLILVRTRNRFFVELLRDLQEREVPVSGADRRLMMEQPARMSTQAPPAVSQCAGGAREES